MLKWNWFFWQMDRLPSRKNRSMWWGTGSNSSLPILTFPILQPGLASFNFPIGWWTRRGTVSPCLVERRVLINTWTTWDTWRGIQGLDQRSGWLNIDLLISTYSSAWTLFTFTVFHDLSQSFTIFFIIHGFTFKFSYSGFGIVTCYNVLWRVITCSHSRDNLYLTHFSISLKPIKRSATMADAAFPLGNKT